ncbi:hypothetical protein HYH03_001810 [Edaphochlamys debaryana]|uniref:CID domain-containing protein n=1 Tax=Edaphochlamys debaryana TaxID=47281 RepID=A0A836C604_9CHLO|nr:hypothetical protein HYH03_001810 [Edaphochlamys debaryana]|eukprot:KAG2500232.1 hypothetical protein HYH03_001810 [Edaphochlamys debaryana]
MAGLSAFGQAYLENLRDLTSADRRSIVTLKDLAFENAEEATNVVKSIRQHIKQCPVAHRLPAVYLVDCMLKAENCPSVYAEQLNKSLLEVFSFVWDNADATTRKALTKACKLWQSWPNFDKKVAQACEAHMVPAASVSMPAVGGVLAPPYQGLPVMQPPTIAAVPTRPLASVGNGSYGGAQQHAPMSVAAVPSYPPAAYPGAYSYHQQHSGFVPQQRPYMQQPVQQQPYYSAQHSVPTRPQVPYPTALPPAPRTTGLLGVQIPVSLLGQPHAQPPSSPQPGPSSPYNAQPAARQRTTEFPGQQLLKELDATAVQDLQAASNRTRPAFLDAAFLRNKRRTTLMATGSASRQWFPTIDMWLQGTTAAPTDNELDIAEDEAEAAKEELYFVEEDPSQPECAMSGEPFERFYDPDSDKWCYKDAVLLSGEDAAKHGVMDGSIVKVHCLAGAPSKLQLATLRAAKATAAAADELRQATITFTAGGGSGVTPTTPPQAPVPALQLEPQPAVAAALIKPEPGPVEAPAGPVGSKRPAPPAEPAARLAAPEAGVAAAAAAGFPDAKRVKLEVQ